MGKTPEPSDEQLVEQARRAADGDSRAFESLVRRHERRVLANCRYLTRSPDEADDLAQEVFMKAFFGLPRFEARSSFRTWIQRIKVNHCLNHIKKRGSAIFENIDAVAAESTEGLSVPPAAERATEVVDMRQRIVRILDTMTDTLRIPLIMRDLDGLSYEEIAAALGAGLSAVKMRIKRAREEFRMKFEPGAAPVDDVMPGAE